MAKRKRFKPDEAHIYTDNELKQYEEDMNRAYTEAYKEIRKELEKQVAKMNLLESMTPEQRMLEATKYNRLEQLERELAGMIKKQNIKSMGEVKKLTEKVFGYNYSFATWQAETRSGLSTNYGGINHDVIKKIMQKNSSVFEQIAFEDIEDKKGIERDLKREFATGIIKGESIPKLANRVKKVTEKNLKQSIRIARTETTRVQNMARQEAYERAEGMGIEMEKVWIATADGRTRETHLELDGARVPLDGVFGHGLRYPADPDADASEVVNCRCTMATEIAGVKKSCKLQELEETVRRMNFEEWERRQADKKEE